MSATNPVARQFATLDASVWRDELLAQRHEAVFVQLADALRHAADRSAVLAAFEFESIQIPRRLGEPALLTDGIQRQRFDDTAPLTLSHPAWQKAVAQFSQAGWSLAQFEWQHERFLPATNERPARSTFAFALHGEQCAQSNRFILRGTLQVDWRSGVPAGNPPRPGQLTIQNLLLLERAGPPGFDRHAIVAPEPDRPDGQVNVHPLIVLDLNGDQHDDIILPGVNRVLLNDGRAQFRDAPFIRPENFYALQSAGVIADFDGDGRLDYLGVADRGPLAGMLVLYAGDGTLPISSPPRAAWPGQRAQPELYRLSAVSALTAADVDGDGDLDVFVAQYRPPYVGGNLPTPYYDANDGYASWLLLNDGHGRFSASQNQAALRARQHRRTLSASFVDLNGDGSMDLVTANDFSGVDLFYNDGHGIFTDESARLDQRHLFGMGLCFADFDHDGALDFLAIGMDVPTVRRLEFLRLAPSVFPERTAQRAEMAWGNRLYLTRAGRWIEPPWAAAVARSGWSWGAAAFDFDNDGALDLYIANGHVSGASSADYDNQYWTHDIYLDAPADQAMVQRYFDHALEDLNRGRTSWNGYQHNTLFLDLGGHDYANVAYLMGVAHETDCRAVAAADLNEDGRVDLLVTEAIWQGTPNRMRHRLLVHLNQAETAGHWIGVQLPALRKGRSTIGAKVTLKAGGLTSVAQVVCGDSFQTQQTGSVHFGLGKITRVDSLEVTWPGGEHTMLRAPAVDRYHRLLQ